MKKIDGKIKKPCGKFNFLCRKLEKLDGKLRILSIKLKSIDGKFKKPYGKFNFLCRKLEKPDGKLRILSRKLKSIDGIFNLLDVLLNIL